MRAGGSGRNFVSGRMSCTQSLDGLQELEVRHQKHRSTNVREEDDRETIQVPL